MDWYEALSAPASVAGPAPNASPVSKEENGQHTCGWSEAIRIALVAFTAVAVRFHLWEPFERISLVGMLGMVIGGWPIFKEAAENVAGRRMTMELSMSIAIAAAAAIGEFFTALIITLFVLAAEVLENLTIARGRRTIRDLMDFLPRSIVVRRDGAVRETVAQEVRTGDSVLVNPGSLIPVDGIVINGHSFVDQARITGESIPAEKVPGSTVYAGTINQSGALEIRTERIGRDTSYGRIIEAVEQAEHSRAPVQRLADRLAGYLVYFALAAALLTFVATRNIRSTIAVIIVAGACGIAAGTPLALLGGIGRAARLGAIIKGGRYLETLGQVDTVVLDKTGTLTSGRTEVQAVLSSPAVSEKEVIETAASAEMRSEHPLARAIIVHAISAGIVVNEPEQLNYEPGRGITALVNGSRILVGSRALMAAHEIALLEISRPAADAGSEVLVARDGHFLGTILIGDPLRPEARRAIASLDRLGIQSILLTGDSSAIANAVGGQLGINQIEAELLPEAKLARVKKLVADGFVVAMIGDGINDAPALAEANVGVAMGSGADVARETGDVLLLGNDLAKFTETLQIARWTRRIIWQNFYGTIAVDVVGIVLAAAGLLNPTLAAFIHLASEMTFILNSTRLLPGFEYGAPAIETSVKTEEKLVIRTA
ncbi:MAG: cation-translocating P-type ATPase [Deltaproteobacteria bacterium]|nr:cation-translocating P-type ATPase [Deltaproteobacteria bacterium]